MKTGGEPYPWQEKILARAAEDVLKREDDGSPEHKQAQILALEHVLQAMTPEGTDVSVERTGTVDGRRVVLVTVQFPIQVEQPEHDNG